MKSILWLVFFTLVFPSISSATTVTMGNVAGKAGDTITVPITVDVPGDIAAATFTVHYDAAVLSLNSVESSFFAAFSEQWNLITPLPNPLPPDEVTVEGTVYNQPLLHNTQSNTTLLSGVRVQTGATQSILFNLLFTIQPDAVLTSSAISLSPTVLNNSTLGYSSDGEEIPVLTGRLPGEADLALAYPALPVSFVDGSIVVILDVDGDSIDDAWEYAYFPDDLSQLSATRDYDNDGYTDLQEYLNSLAGLDADGLQWDPRNTQNAPDQNGYVPPGQGKFWIMIMPAIQAGASQD